MHGHRLAPKDAHGGEGFLTCPWRGWLVVESQVYSVAIYGTVVRRADQDSSWLRLSIYQTTSWQPYLLNLLEVVEAARSFSSGWQRMSPMDSVTASGLAILPLEWRQHLCGSKAFSNRKKVLTCALMLVEGRHPRSWEIYRFVGLGGLAPSEISWMHPPRPCLVHPKYQLWHYTKRRFPVTLNLWYMHRVLNVDEIKN